ncbi:putative NAD(P)-binding protein YbjT [Vibrio crassostreae]|nr:putative NAD(P)-binding protein YbjT [Vibrio crassostreae]CAK2222893.1 putative NAD(P)-binding protein YbjT [Vibrio crassostreae]CAK2391785.1 putative NAD(P)-binding protein YbjT [Vibrio crassostreae]CAK2581844.1 putative NAD(P)-binding protein YbjT [Vibrio crassostreae]
MKKVLVLGASGYVGSQLLPLLLEQGYQVTAAARHIDYLKARTEPHENLSLEYLDLADQAATQALVPDFDLIFFLVHGMAEGHDFIDYELNLARNFVSALGPKNQHVIYLSSLQPQTGDSEHLQARKKTGELLRKGPVPITELQAGVIIGPGSAAFEIMRDFVYNLPIMIAPKWVDSKANPIALQNLNHYLLKLAQYTPIESQTFEVGGPDIVSYRNQFAHIAKTADRPLRLWATSLLTPKIASYWLGVVTSVPSNIGRALLAGLKHDFIASSTTIREKYPQRLISFENMVEQAIHSEGNFVKSNVWGFDKTAFKRWQAGYGYYPKKTGASIMSTASLESLWQVAQQIGSPKQGYFFANALWRTREWLDLLFGGGVPVRQMPEGPKLKVGDKIDSWKVIRCEENQFLSLLFGMKGPGLGRLEITVSDHGESRELNISAWWHPKGFLGLLYWFAMMPAHLFIFKGMVKAIEKQAKEQIRDSSGEMRKD